MDVSQRKQAYLRKAATAEMGRAGWSALAARSHAGDAGTAEQWMNTILDEADQRMDCTDFRLNLLLRALSLYGDKVCEAVKRRFRKTALATRYYGGFSRDWPMFYSSENHHLNWAAAEYLVGQLWPEAVFEFDGRRGHEHVNRARFLIARWIDHRARWGYGEWNSSCYAGVNMISLLNLADFAGEADIRRLAGDAMTQLLADLAADSAYGGVWAAQARLYQDHLFDCYGQNVSPAFAILLGVGEAEKVHPSGTADAIATTQYRAPQWVCDLAGRLEGPIVNLERHREERGLYYSCHSVFWKPPVELVEDKYKAVWHPEDIFSMAVRTERRAEYLVSAAMRAENLPQRHGFHQSMVWMSSLKGRVTVFTTQPSRRGADPAEGQYWGGSAVTPRCYLRDGVLAAVYGAPDDYDQAGDFTHAHFPTASLSQWHRDGRWFFGRLDDAYVALHAPQGATLTAEGMWAGREIKAPGRRAAWLAVFGSRSQDGDFERFCRRAQAVTIAFDAETAVADVRAGETSFRVAYNEGVFVDGKWISFETWKQIDNPVVTSDFGEPVLHVRTADGPQTLDFTEAGRIAEAAYRQL